jgi:hypothetical protein
MKYTVVSPGVFRRYKLHDNFGHKSYKTYVEAVDAMVDNEHDYRTNYLHRADGGYSYRIDMIVTTIIDHNGIRVNEIP